MADQASCRDIPIKEGKPKQSSTTKQVADNHLKQNNSGSSSNINEVAISITGELLHSAPQTLKQIDSYKKYFEPRVVSLGPFHFKKEHLQITGDNKRTVKNLLLQGRKTVEDFDKEMTNALNEAKYLYAKDSNASSIDPKTFNEMMILDACFIIHVIDFIIQADEKTKPRLSIRPHLLPLVVEDMFLLENQVPFVVLNASMILLGKNAKDMICQFVNKVIEPPKILEERTCIDNLENKFTFLAEVVKIAMQIMTLGRLREQWEQQRQYKNNRNEFWAGGEPFHLLQILRAHLLSYAKETESDPVPNLWHPLRTATQLKAAGIKFKGKSTCSLMEVKFQKGAICGKLHLPSITHLTKRRLLNLIAYELCPGGAGYGITSYVHFLDGLIDCPQDVNELRSKHILPKGLGSDEEVSHFFNTVGADLTSDPSIYEKALEDIEAHCKSKWRGHMAELWYKHFMSPWTTISFLLAAVAFLYSILEAYTKIFNNNDKKQGN